MTLASVYNWVKQQLDLLYKNDLLLQKEMEGQARRVRDDLHNFRRATDAALEEVRELRRRNNRLQIELGALAALSTAMKAQEPETLPSSCEEPVLPGVLTAESSQPLAAPKQNLKKPYMHDLAETCSSCHG